MPLRPALKAQLDLSGLDSSGPFPFSSSSRVLDSPRVHFPPTPTLTSIALTHSPHAYDRAPIQVVPNTCALPERGARVYFAAEGNESSSPSATECYFQQRRPSPIHSMHAWTEEGAQYSISLIPPDSSTAPMPILNSYSSESDSSDGQYGSPSSPSNAHRLGSRQDNHRSSRFNETLSPYGLSENRRSAVPQADNTDALTLACPSPTKYRAKNGLKKKKDRLQADQAYRTSYSTTNDDSLLEGCLGGF